MYIEFNDSLRTGHELIDGQHQEWIDRINKLLHCVEDGKGKVEAVQMLNYVADYTDFHFEAEEKLQEEAGYPGIAEHKEKHEAFRKVVDELHEMLEEEEGPSEAFVKAVENNMLKWLTNHIQTFDCSVASYVNLKNNPNLV